MLEQRSRDIKRVLWVVLWLNVAVALAKLAIGYAIHSLAMVADGFHSLLDGSSNVVGLVGMWQASHPPDEDHPYGRHKYEAFSALAISVLLGITALEVARSAIDALTGTRQAITPTLWSVAVMVATMGVNALVTRYESARGRRLQSEILLADAEHTRSDIIVSGSVLLGLGAAWMGFWWVDILAAFVISGFILYISYSILKRTASVLTDSAVVNANQVRELVMEVPEVLDTSNIRSRGMMPYIYLDLEIQVDPDTPLWKAHLVAHAVENHLRDRVSVSDVVVHVEPYKPKIPPREHGQAHGHEPGAFSEGGA